ncbi:MAG TPA: hypothetical protein VNM67_04865 [Thermoanaerobaculia bacterium]|jgi:hypothetical protein|nr:hypothetical protein [Thermoanaerobaculia bacterium]
MTEDTVNKRPIGVTLLAILNLLSGIAIIVIAIFMGAGLNEIDADLEKIGASALLVRASALLLGGLFVATGFALWGGRTKGWWFATWVIGMMGVNTLLTAVTIGDLAANLGVSSIEVTPHRVKFLVRGLLYFAILFYLFRPRVLEFFGVGSESRGPAFLKLVGAVGVGVVIWWIGGYFAGG